MKRLLVALAISGALFPSPAAAHYRGCDGHGLGHHRCHRVMESARRLTPLSKRAIKRRIFDHHRRIRALPTVRHLRRRPIPLEPAVGRGGGRCRKESIGLVYQNIFGGSLASARLGKRWCYRDGVVTTHPRPGVSIDITALGGITGWSYGGVVWAENYFERYRGRRHGAHSSRRQVSFSVCIAKVGCYQQPTPTIRATGRGDGTFGGSAYR